MKQKKHHAGYEWIILVLLLLSQLILSMGAYAWGPLGPFVKKSLSLTPVQVGSLTSTIYLTAVIFSIPSGISVDRWGVKLNLFICMMLMGTGMLLAGFTDSYMSLLILMTLAGASYGMINPIASKALTVWFDTTFRATAFGIRQMGVTAGGAIAGVLLIYLAQLKDWNLAVSVVGLLAILIGIDGILFYKESPAKPGKNDKNRAKAAFDKKNNQNASIFDLMKNRDLILACLIMTLLCLGQSSIGAFLVLYLEEDLGFPALPAGSFLTAAMISGGVARVFWGLISDKLFNARRLPVMKIICALAAISSLITCFWVNTLPNLLFILIAVIFGFSYLGFQGIAVVLLVEASGAESAGKATGLGITIAWVGMVLGPIIYGTLVPQGYFFAWLFVAITSFASFLLCCIIRETA